MVEKGAGEEGGRTPRPTWDPASTSSDTRADHYSPTDVSESTAKKDNLVWVNPKDETVHLRVDNSASSGSTRNAIKLTGKKTYNTGLFLFDIERQPQCVFCYPSP